MLMFCGLDFGTSNSAIGTILSGKPALVSLENYSPILPSAIFFNFETDETIFGSAAIQSYTNGVDGRLMRALKSILGSSVIYEDTHLKGKKFITYEEAIGLFLAHIKNTAQNAAGREIEQVVMGRPVYFVDDDAEADQKAQNTLEAICRSIGFKEIIFQLEPVAAVKNCVQSIRQEEIILVVDIGGGTSDFSLVHTIPGQGQTILSNAGLHLGGTDFDKLLSLQYIMPLLGYGTQLNPKEIPFPSYYFIDLSTWSQINFLHADRTIAAKLKNLMAQAREPDKVKRLLKVIEEQLGYELIFSVEHAKIELSDEEASRILLSFIEDGLELTIDRHKLDAAICGALEKLTDTISACLQKTGIKENQVDAVFFTGGSTLIPGIRGSVVKRLSNARVIQGDKFGAVALGLTMEASERFI